ncbi:hypothetical protein LguiB_009469 [Lonicera macranthoides]
MIAGAPQWPPELRWAVVAEAQSQKDHLDFLPEKFLYKTREQVLVVSYRAHRRAKVLVHDSTGGHLKKECPFRKPKLAFVEKSGRSRTSSSTSISRGQAFSQLIIRPPKVKCLVYGRMGHTQYSCSLWWDIKNQPEDPTDSSTSSDSHMAYRMGISNKGKRPNKGIELSTLFAYEGFRPKTSRTSELRATTSFRVEGYPHQSAHPS